MKSYTQLAGDSKAEWLSLGDAVANVLADAKVGRTFNDSAEILAAALDAEAWGMVASGILAHDKSANLLPAEAGRLFAIAHLGRAVNEQDEAALRHIARVFLGEVRP